MNILVTETEIQNEQARRGLSHDQAAERLEARHEKETSRLEEVAPEAADVIAKAMLVAQEAMARARKLAAGRRAMMDALEQKLCELARRRQEIEQVRALGLTQPDTAKLGRLALDNFLANLRSEQHSNASAFANSLRRLAELGALAPHVPAFVQELQKAADDLRQEIRATATAEKVSLKNLLKIMAHEAGAQPGEHDARNRPLLKLFEAGFFADLE